MWRKVSFANKTIQEVQLIKVAWINIALFCWFLITQDRATYTGLSKHRHKKELLPRKLQTQTSTTLATWKKKKKRETEHSWTFCLVEFTNELSQHFMWTYYLDITAARRGDKWCNLILADEKTLVWKSETKSWRILGPRAETNMWLCDSSQRILRFWYCLKSSWDTQMLVTVKKSSQKTCWPTAGQPSAVCRPSVGLQLADCQPTGFALNTDYQTADNQPTVARQLVTCRTHVGNMCLGTIYRPC